MEAMRGNEDGLAYGYMMIAMYLAAVVIIWFGWTFMYDLMLTTSVNPAIEDGTMSVQAVYAGNWNVNVMKYAPPAFLIFGLGYAVNRAIYAKGRGM